MPITQLPEMLEVDSSNISKIGYDEHNHKLYVEFSDGSLYCYSPVLKDSWEDFKKTESKGKWVWNNLRHKKVPCEAVPR